HHGALLRAEPASARPVSGPAPPLRGAGRGQPAPLPDARPHAPGDAVLPGDLGHAPGRALRGHHGRAHAGGGAPARAGARRSPDAGLAVKPWFGGAARERAEGWLMIAPAAVV